MQVVKQLRFFPLSLPDYEIYTSFFFTLTSLKLSRFSFFSPTQGRLTQRTNYSLESISATQVLWPIERSELKFSKQTLLPGPLDLDEVYLRSKGQRNMTVWRLHHFDFAPAICSAVVLGDRFTTHSHHSNRLLSLRPSEINDCTQGGDLICAMLSPQSN